MIIGLPTHPLTVKRDGEQVGGEATREGKGATKDTTRKTPCVDHRRTQHDQLDGASCYGMEHKAVRVQRRKQQWNLGWLASGPTI